MSSDIVKIDDFTNATVIKAKPQQKNQCLDASTKLS